VNGQANIYMRGGKSALYVNNTHFFSSYGGDGGAVKLFVGPHAEFFNCIFEDLVAVGAGGAIFMEQNVGLGLFNCTFRNNLAITEGGAVYAYGTNNVQIVDSQFVSNRAQVGGGALAIGEESRAFINRTLMFNNTAFYGGGIFIEYSSLVHLENDSIIYNGANATMGHGGGLYCSDSKLFITTTTVSNNIAGDSDKNLYCAGIPAFSWCTVTGDSDWSSKCGEPSYSSDFIPGLPTLAIIGIALAAIGLLVCAIAIGVCVRFKTQQRTQKKRK